jgi:hypothetical protein
MTWWTRKKMFAAALAGLALMASTVAGCGGYDEERGWGDAPISERDDGAWQIINSPDKFPNIATRCNPYQKGTRIYIQTHTDQAKTQLVLQPDESCR